METARAHHKSHVVENVSKKFDGTIDGKRVKVIVKDKEYKQMWFVSQWHRFKNDSECQLSYFFIFEYNKIYSTLVE